MSIPNFFQQSQQSMQQGVQLGSALRNAQAMSEQRDFAKQMQPYQLQEAEYQSKLRPMQLEQQQLQNKSIEQDNLRKNLAQDSILLSSLSEEDGKKVIPQLINKYEGNDAVVAGFNKVFKSTGKEYIKNNLMAVSAFTGKPIGGESQQKTPTKVKELEAAGYVQGTPEFQDAMKSLIFKDNEGKTSLKASDIKGMNKDVTDFVSPWKEVYSAAKELDKLGDVNSAPAQMAMVFKYMKALDPTSVVRETEYASARNTTGVPDQILNYYNKLVDGSLLNKQQVKEFVDVSKQLANSRAEGVEKSVTEYLEPYGDMIDNKKKKAFMDRAKVKMFDINPTNAQKEQKTIANNADLTNLSLEELKALRSQY